MRTWEVKELLDNLFNDGLLNGNCEIHAMRESVCEILEKQIPKKPYGKTFFECPTCNEILALNTSLFDAQNHKYCRHCGQAIDWEGVNNDWQDN